MPRTHVVVEGENLSKIAAAEGFRDFRSVYDAPENAELRSKRPNPNLIVPGDEVVIPDKKPATVKMRPGSTVVVQKLPPAPMPDAIEVGFAGAQNKPIAGLKVELVSAGKTFKRTTDPNGLILLQDPSLTASSVVDVVKILDDAEKPPIVYDEFARKGLVMNTSSTLLFPDKRAIINRIMVKHGVERRASWKARAPKLELEQDWDFDMVVIHHSGNSGRKDPREIQDFHMDSRDFDDVAYQFMVRPSGAIVEGRYLSKKGASNAAVNTGKLAIIVLGDFEHGALDFSDDDPTAAQIASANALVKTLVAEFPKLKRLVGHRDIKSDTECPGGELHKRLPEIRAGTGLTA